MGLFERLRQAIEESGPTQAAGGPGEPGRGVVTAVKHAMAGGDRSSRVGAKVRVQARLGDGLGPETAVKIQARWYVVALLERNLDIPVHVDPATGAVTAIDVPRLTEELEPRKKEAKQRSSGWGFDLGMGGITQAPAALRDIVSPSAPAPLTGTPATAGPGPAPINGVTWDQLVQASAYCAVHPKGGWSEATQHVGLAPEVFSAAHGSWTTRMAQEACIRGTPRRWMRPPAHCAGSSSATSDDGPGTGRGVRPLPLWTEPPQPEAVGHHEDAGGRHRSTGQHRVEQGEGNGGDVVGERPEQVAADSAERAPRQPAATS
jgi:hypothetical protein